LGGVPQKILSDNPKTVANERDAGIAHDCGTARTNAADTAWKLR